MDWKRTKKMKALRLAELLSDLRTGLDDLQQVPEIQVAAAEIPWHLLDPGAAFVLSRIDGRRCYADLLDLGGVGAAEARRLLTRWLVRGLIAHKRL